MWEYDISHAIGHLGGLVLFIVLLVSIIKINREINRRNKGLESIRENKKDGKMEDIILGRRVSTIGRTDSSMTLVFDNDISLIIYAHEWYKSSFLEDRKSNEIL